MKTFVFYFHLFGLHISYLVFIYLFKFLATRLAPPFENPAYATRTGVGNLFLLGCIRPAKFFFLPWFCRFITSHPVSQPSVSFSALNFDLIRSIHRQLGTMVLGKVRLLLSCGKISLAVVEQAWKNITKHKQLVNKLRLTFHDQVKIT